MKLWPRISLETFEIGEKTVHFQNNLHIILKNNAALEIEVHEKVLNHSMPYVSQIIACSLWNLVAFQIHSDFPNNYDLCQASRICRFVYIFTAMCLLYILSVESTNMWIREIATTSLIFLDEQSTLDSTQQRPRSRRFGFFKGVLTECSSFRLCHQWPCTQLIIFRSKLQYHWVGGLELCETGYAKRDRWMHHSTKISQRLWPFIFCKYRSNIRFSRFHMYETRQIFLQSTTYDPESFTDQAPRVNPSLRRNDFLT